jgi:hypothetical protein
MLESADNFSLKKASSEFQNFNQSEKIENVNDVTGHTIGYKGDENFELLS